jgi:hypothetical protein
MEEEAGAGPKWKERLATLAKQPLLQFAVLGGALFLVLGDGVDAPDDAMIVVDPALRERLSRQYEAQLGAFPSPGEMQALVDKHVRDEMLYREALRLGLDEGDEIVRRRLVQKMEFLAESAVTPSEEDLRAWYEDHRDEFGEPPRASITQRYFSPDRHGWDGAREFAQAAMADGRKRGEASPVSEEFEAIDPQQAGAAFGDSDMAKAIFTAPIGEWSGPFRSGYGWHLLLVEAREDPEGSSFEDVVDQVALRWNEANRQEQLELMLKELGARYRVEESE